MLSDDLDDNFDVQAASAAAATPAPDGIRVLVGNRKLMVEHGVALPRGAVEYVRQQEGAGCTCMLVAGGDRSAYSYPISAPDTNPSPLPDMENAQRLGCGGGWLTDACSFLPSTETG